MPSDYCLRVIRADNLHWQPTLHDKVPDLYAEGQLGNVTRRTRTIKRNLTPVWDEVFVFSSSDIFIVLTIQVKHESGWSKDPCIGRVEIKLIDLLTRCAPGLGNATLPLSSGRHGAAQSTGQIILHLDVIDEMMGVEISLATAQEDIRHGKIMRYAGASDVTHAINNQVSQLSSQRDLCQAVCTLIGKLNVFRQAMDTMSEIHPFLTIAWKLASGLLTAIQKVCETDRRIVDLVRNMDDAFAFVCDVQGLPRKTVSLQKAIVGMLKQTIECCLFVSRYASRSFLKRVFDATSIQKIDEFERALANFKQQIESGVILQTAVVSMRTPGAIDELVLRQRLNPSLSDAFNRPTCLPDTRTDIRKKILEWAFADSEQNIFWLHGVAGSGKSTVSTTIVQHLRDMSRLGAFLFFERGKSEPSSVIRTIAYKLALYDSSIGESILEKTNEDKDIFSSLSEDQFTKLLLRPLSEMSKEGPIVIVLDALDECGTTESRLMLMQLFRNGFSRLPKNFRFLITSRREADIDRVLSSQPESILAEELDYTSSTSHQDVLSYLRIEMQTHVKDQVSIPEDWPWDENIMQLGKAAGGLFIWASTAVKMVRNSDDHFYHLNCLVSDSKSVSGFGLDELYGTVLRDSGILWEEERSRQRFRKVLALLLLSKAPISSRMIDDLLGFRPHESCTLILSKLQSLVSYTIEGPVSLFHTSFSDYLTSSKHSHEPWFINVLDARQLIVERCFCIMENMLHFNMCNLETSFVHNDDVQGISDRVKECIPSHLEYVCMHWAQHLCDVPYSPDLLDKLSDFAYKSLLFWFEVLSLVKMFVRVANRSLLQAVMWIESTETDVTSFLRDASELATIFAIPIMESTPHIYVTMIPVSKDESMVSAHYSTQMSSMVHVQTIGSKRPLGHMRVLEGHKDVVWSVAVSSDGRLIASDSGDGTIKVWDFHSGEVIITLEDNSCQVSFFPDGRRLASVSYVRDGGLRIWDVQTGEVILGPLHGKDQMHSVAISPDGTRVASRHSNGWIVLWDMSVGTELKRFDVDRADVSCVVFSPDGTLLASGSADGSASIWEIDSGEPTFRTLAGIRTESFFLRLLSQPCHLVSFTPDSKYIVSSCPTQIRIHEVESGSVAFVFCGSDGEYAFGVRALSCFPCGTRAVVECDSERYSFSVLDLTNGKVVSGPFEGHMGEINSVAITPDGRHIISGSEDGTVRIWDTAAANDGSKTFEAHRNILNVIISDDESRIASCSGKSIIIWDTQTGDVVLGPLDAGDVTCMAFSPDNSRLVSGSDRISVWDVATSQLVFSPIEGHSGIFCIVISPDGTLIASGQYDGTLKVWEIVTGQDIIEPLDVFTGEVTSLEFSPNGNRLVSGSKNGNITVWNTVTWEVISEFSSEHGCIYSIRFSPDGTQLAFESYRGYDAVIVTVLDVEQGHVIADPFELPEYAASLLAFSLDGLYYVAANKYLRYISVRKLLDADGARSTCDPRMFHYFDEMTSPSFASSRNGSRIVSCLDEETIRVWDVSDLLLTKRNKDRSNALSKWILADDGWIVAQTDNEKRDLIVWVPHDLRPTLCQARNTTVLNCKFFTKLDFLGAALGDRWSECFVPSHRRALA
ncbi:hypothetical protein ACEPAG_3420 [Sanghuangporus baumii]